MKDINITVEGKILDAISQAKERLQEIVSINIPSVEQGELLKTMILSTGKRPVQGLKIETLYGLPVKKGKVLSITLKI